MSTFVPNTTKTVLVPVSQELDYTALIGMAVATYGVELTFNRVITLDHEMKVKIDIEGEPDSVAQFARMIDGGEFDRTDEGDDDEDGGERMGLMESHEDDMRRHDDLND